MNDAPQSFQCSRLLSMLLPTLLPLGRTLAFLSACGSTAQAIWRRDALFLRPNACVRMHLPAASASVHCFPLNEHKTETAL